MAVDFRIAKHHIRPGITIVEVLINGSVAAVIHPEGDKGIKLMSAHIEETKTDKDFGGEVVQDDSSRSVSPIPAVHIRFNPSPYVISGGKIVKLPIH